MEPHTLQAEEADDVVEMSGLLVKSAFAMMEKPQVRQRLVSEDSSGLRAVLWDMDGTLVDSEKLWDVSMRELYARFGGVLSPEVRESTVGGSAKSVMDTVYADLGLDPDPAAIAASTDWLHVRTGELFAAGLPWRPGARELLDALVAEGIPMALVTNTRRDLTEQALKSIGKQYFSVSVCADEVQHGKPAPDVYLSAAELLGFEPAQCLAIEDSVTGTVAAESAGCPVLVVPNDVDVPGSARRRHVRTLVGLSPTDLRQIYAELGKQFDDGVLPRG